MSLPSIARVRRRYQQPSVADVRAATEAAIRQQSPGDAAGSGQPRWRSRPAAAASARNRPDRSARRSRPCDRSASSHSWSPRWEATAAAPRPGKRAPRRAGRDRSHASAARSVRAWIPSSSGTNSFGLPIHLDRNAYEADGIILLNRIKPHTSFTGRYESGLLKMLSIGLGKRQGAAQVHKLGLPGLSRLIPEVGAFLLEKAPVVLGRGDPRERPRGDGPDRGRRARGDPGGRAQAARRGRDADGPAARSTRSTCWSSASWARTTAGPGSTPT